MRILFFSMMMICFVTCTKIDDLCGHECDHCVSSDSMSVNPNPDSIVYEYSPLDKKELSNSSELPLERSSSYIVEERLSNNESKVLHKKEIVTSESKSTIQSTNDLGQVIYKVPDTMKVMNNYEVIVRISKSSNNVEITSNLNGKIFSKNIKTSNKMQVELVDPTNSFQIKEINNQKQLVDSTYTEWKFNVLPLKPGSNKLDLVVSIIRGDDIKQVVFSDEIFVHSNTPAQIKEFWYENWKWSMEKLIIPVITWFFGIWWGKRSEKKKKK
jgi:hypothetical protein